MRRARQRAPQLVRRHLPPGDLGAGRLAAAATARAPRARRGAPSARGTPTGAAAPSAPSGRAKLLNAAGNVLSGLGDSELVGAALSLHGYDELLAVTANSDVKLVDLDLTHTLHERLKVVLQGIRRDTKKDVDQAVIADLGEEDCW